MDKKNLDRLLKSLLWITNKNPRLSNSRKLKFRRLFQIQRQKQQLEEIRNSLKKFKDPV